jgi:ribosomal-protein-alanine N-acetyltransferase
VGLVYPIMVGGERLRLRDFAYTDLDACMEIVGDPEVTSSLSFDTRTREEQSNLLIADITRAQSEPRPDFYFAVVENSTDSVVGFVRLGIGRPRTAELGYAIRRDRWGLGYATEASATMLTFGFEKLDMHRIQAACGPENLASQRVLSKLGFLYEGRMRDHVFTNGAWRDSLLYSLLDSEWPTRTET